MRPSETMRLSSVPDTTSPSEVMMPSQTNRGRYSSTLRQSSTVDHRNVNSYMNTHMGGGANYEINMQQKAPPIAYAFWQPPVQVKPAKSSLAASELFAVRCPLFAGSSSCAHLTQPL